jgi:hypothetical protein
MKIKFLLAFCFVICSLSSFSQTILYTLGIHHHVSKGSSYFSYYVNSQEYEISLGLPGFGYQYFPNKFIRGYFVGYDSLAPEKGKVYYNKPLYDDSIDTAKIANAAGKIIKLYEGFCVYQFMANKKNNEPVTSYQIISKEDIEQYQIKPGSTCKVQYFKEYPEDVIMYYNVPGYDTLIDHKNPFHSKLNGFALDLEADVFVLNPSAVNRYLKKYGQSSIYTVTPDFLANFNYYYKSGFWFGIGVGGGPTFATGRTGVGFMKKLDKKLYISFSTNIAFLESNISAFKNDQFATVAAFSHFRCRDWYVNPKVDFLWRVYENPGRGCQFIKIGIGAYLNFTPNKKWTYLTEQSTPNKSSGGGQNTSFTYVADVNNMPSLSTNLFYISVSYSLCGFDKQ